MLPRLRDALADSGPVVVLASIAAAGSFTHIRDTADQHGQHGWMAWAIAVCIDLTCVMAARERQRDRRTDRRTRAGVLADVGSVRRGVAVPGRQPRPSRTDHLGMADRRDTGRRVPRRGFDARTPLVRTPPGRPAVGAVPGPAVLRTAVPGPRPRPGRAGRRDGSRTTRRADETTITPRAPGPAGELVAFARRVADEHQTRHGRPITRDALRARLGVSNQLASDLLRQIRTA